MTPIDYSRYAPDWRQISQRIRTDRAGDRCERCAAANGQPHPVTGSRVVLTVAHLDHDVAHNAEENLLALCQRCHLAHDARHHARNAAATRKRRREEAGQQRLGVERGE